MCLGHTSKCQAYAGNVSSRELCMHYLSALPIHSDIVVMQPSQFSLLHLLANRLTKRRPVALRLRLETRQEDL